jgi:hypothetical protein
MIPIEIRFTVEPSISPCDLSLEFLIDNHVMWSNSCLSGPETVRVIMDDSNHTMMHTMMFRMQGKTWQHTKIVDDVMLEDHVIYLRDLTVEGVLIQPVLENTARYDHDFNGSSCRVQDKFFGVMGCNGEVSMEFSTPIFLWLLENA